MFYKTILKAEKLWLMIFCFIRISCYGRDEKLYLKNKRSSKWSTWSSWTACSKTEICYSGSRMRRRNCLVNENKHCVGVYMENEDCPVKKCLETNDRIFSDTARASFPTFISQECNVDIKFSYSGLRSNMIPKEVKQYCNKFPLKFQLGYFNIQKLVGNETINLENMTKFCFEPYHMKTHEAKTLATFNRKTKSNLYKDDSAAQDENVAGVVIVTSQITKQLSSIYFATKSNGFGYNKVFYKRWKGNGLEETL